MSNAMHALSEIDTRTTARIACPACGGWESAVRDSRGTGNCIRRRRQCLRCSNRFTTHETTEGILSSQTQGELRRLILQLDEMRKRLELLLDSHSEWEA